MKKTIQVKTRKEFKKYVISVFLPCCVSDGSIELYNILEILTNWTFFIINTNKETLIVEII